MQLRPVDPELIDLGTAEAPTVGSRVVGAGEHASVVILGCAADEGPTEIRRWLYRQTTGIAGELASIRLADLGDLRPASTTEETDREIESILEGEIRKGAHVVFLGGPSTLACGSMSAPFTALQGRGALLYLDARPPAASRTLAERWGSRLATYVSLGTQSHHASPADVAFARPRSGRFVSLDELRQQPGVAERIKRELGAVAGPVDFAGVSLSLGVAAGAIAPGVHGGVADGFTAEDLLRAADTAGRHPKVRALDVLDSFSETDENGRTARLAAAIVWKFLAALATRLPK